MAEEKTQSQDKSERAATYRARQRRSLTGMFAGLGLGMMVGALVPWVRQNVDLVSLVLWCSVAGIVLVNLERFAEAGVIITRNEDNKPLNYLVGLGFPVLLLLLFAFLTRGAR